MLEWINGNGFFVFKQWLVGEADVILTTDIQILLHYLRDLLPREQVHLLHEPIMCMQAELTLHLVVLLLLLSYQSNVLLILFLVLVGMTHLIMHGLTIWLLLILQAKDQVVI